MKRNPRQDANSQHFHLIHDSQLSSSSCKPYDKYTDQLILMEMEMQKYREFTMARLYGRQDGR